jgi:hypothetical protein
MTAAAVTGNARECISWVLKQPEHVIKAQPHLFTPLAFHQMQKNSATEIQPTGT